MGAWRAMLVQRALHVAICVSLSGAMLRGWQWTGAWQSLVPALPGASTWVRAKPPAPHHWWVRQSCRPDTSRPLRQSDPLCLKMVTADSSDIMAHLSSGCSSVCQRVFSGKVMAALTNQLCSDRSILFSHSVPAELRRRSAEHWLEESQSVATKR